ncbi:MULTISPECIES: PEN-N family class A beta-lactamase [Burkholderia]|uniref:PEN-N family class A beta-lactamase n=1 Tax=Burkholderia TaxID=32008 RepID=UPI00119AEC1C|nr:MULTISPECIES: PEN-N family class A beta-lactamase [Burkholderia]MDN7737905.1 PEN-N family class A beta-lactamase [Burkholderia gladioli]TWC75514.1 beta-lactamase class A [Burkholderia sp. SJZ089]TWD05027.1 beta-lactamase class A [Burkholderia sp. SJZ115]
MTHSPLRRSLLLAAVSAPVLAACAVVGHQDGKKDGVKEDARTRDAARQIAALESSFGGRIGVSAIDTGSGRRILHRADERFALCSTFKVVLVSAVLARATGDARLLSSVIRYTRHDLVSYSPVTEKNLATGMTVAALCAAAIQYSDNTAANLLIRLIGDPAAVTAYARSIGDASFRLDRLETELNEAVPGDERDTTTPAAMADTLRRVTLGDGLDPSGRAQLVTWMLGNTTGETRIRAGVPAGWRVADKTGSGDYGTANDVAVLYSPSRQPVVLTVYTTRPGKDAKYDNATLAAVARIVTATFA